MSTPRAGSTMLGAILGNHPKILCPPETWMLLPFQSIISKESVIIAPYDHELLQNAWSNCLDSRLYHRAARAFSSLVYRALLIKAGKEYIVDKTPRYYHILDLVDKLYPNAPKIWLKRNPLDTIASCKTTWGIKLEEALGDNISPHSFDTTISFQLLLNFFRTPKDKKYIVKYEELVANPSYEIDKMLDFLQLEKIEGVINYQSNQEQMKQIKNSGFGDTSVLFHQKPHKNSVNKWEQELDDKEAIKIIDTLGRQLFEDLGYREELLYACQKLGLDYDHLSAKGKIQSIFEKLKKYSIEKALNSRGGQRIKIQRKNEFLEERYQKISELLIEKDQEIELLKGKLNKIQESNCRGEN
jgi:hypothetical protein